MELYMEKMNRDYAAEILSWKYEAPYDFYNDEPTEAAVNEMLAHSYFAVLDADRGLIGFFCTGIAARVPNDSYAYSGDRIDISIGMKPKLTGGGYGTSFFAGVLSFIHNLFGDSPKRLTVAAFNRRAIRLYEKFGFRNEAEFHKGSVKFISMVRSY